MPKTKATPRTRGRARGSAAIEALEEAAELSERAAPNHSDPEVVSESGTMDSPEPLSLVEPTSMPGPAKGPPKPVRAQKKSPRKAAKKTGSDEEASAGEKSTRWRRRRDGAVLRSTTVHLPERVAKALRLRAAVDDRRLSDIVTDALEVHLAEELKAI